MIKAFIIAAVTADGFIAKDQNHAAFWTSKEDKARFVELTKKAGVVVMGSQTYKTLPRPLQERVNIVYSRDKNFEGAEVTQDDPYELMRKLEARGFSEVAICGGSQIYSMFMKAKLVDKLYLTIEPLVFGSGITLFKEDMLFDLTLLSHTKTDKHTLLLEYKVNHHGGQSY
nr:Dihydrofolate reductase [uncultured bacterium]